AHQGMGRAQGGVAAQVDLAPRREPPQAEPRRIVGAQQEGRLRLVVLARQRLHPAVVGPLPERLHHAGGIALERGGGEGVDGPLAHQAVSGSITVSSGQRPRALSTTRRQSRASPRCGLGRRVIENTSSSPNGAAMVTPSSASSRTPTAKAGATKRDRASSVAATGAERSPNLPSNQRCTRAWFLASTMSRNGGSKAAATRLITASSASQLTSGSK